jgi:hypothetical protein
VRSIPVGPDGQPIFASVAKQSASPAAPVKAAPLSYASTAPLAAVSSGAEVADVPAAVPAIEAPIPRTRPARFNEVPANAVAETSSDVRAVGGSGVNVRSGPSSSADTLFVLGAGASVTVLDKERGWLKVVDENGRTGWAYGDFID